ncbi:NAD(P)/FAD-dependent oxidoreductase [Methylobacterium nonmethylotrophicum]|uniref:Pyridine nucleotide-disulfide oxidoreductase n=1 Tax=Methylobacterium nonmethylotrophicum TaxID=1141884 RepID=A0A4Z0NGE1_9HYPH|nr:FAD-dependent oxidoreductase [Methylobacterium nonmethylotrophicum]TGD95280.1 pyridine nucleotide-disulfide oxidoreductase [Methylobacterium nonmethylotrophicum]
MSAGGDIVIVGAGQAGFQAAASLREGGFDGSLTIVGDESVARYQRPPLSKAYLAGQASGESLALRPARFYADHRIAIRLGIRATAVDRAARRVAVASGEPLAYDHLILATGARNRPLAVPGADLQGVLQLRTLAEADAVRRSLTGRERIVVVGAGFIGLEVAAAAAARGIAVTVVETAERVMARAVSRPISAFFRTAHEAAGIRFVLGAGVERIAGRGGRVAAVETADGRSLAADLVLVGIGVVPNVDLAAAAGLPVADGILVDHRLLTSDPSISAIGDCAAFPSPFAGNAPTRIESVQNAVDQARCVAARLTGRAAPYGALPWFWSDQGRVKLQIAGLATPHDLAVTRGDPASGAFSVFRYREERLVAVESVNRPADHMVARRLIAQRAPLPAGQAADPAFDLRALVGHAAAA